MDSLPILVEATRGPLQHFETRHAGTIAVVDGEGARLAAVGDIDLAFPLRSTTKPFQLLPYLMDGLHRDHPRGGNELLADLAVMMASHGGEPMHTERVKGLLKSYGLSPEALLCGAHWPYDVATRDALACSGKLPENLHSNCSGKHAGMLAVCLRRGWPLESYTDSEHPLQKRIHDVVAALCRAKNTPLAHSIDGCSLPTHWVSMRGLAQMYAALAYAQGAPKLEGREIAEELELLFAAGTRHPEMVAGTDRFDTRVMTSFKNGVFAKGGAAGVYALSVAPRDGFSKGLGVAFKMGDGDADARVRPVVACEILKQLDIRPDSTSAESLTDLAGADILNVRGIKVGNYRATFQLR